LEIIKQGVLDTVPAEAIYLFGSYAYGTPREDSDLDIFVVIPDSVEERPLDIMVDIMGNVHRKTKTPVDIIANKASVFRHRKQGPTLQRVIAQKGVCIYGM
jgi:predicted nucleotidyltransferase